MRRVLSIFCCSLLIHVQCYATITASAVWEIRTAGADTQCGGFKTGATGTDYSQQNGKRTAGDVTDISTTDAVAVGTTTITSITANFAATIVGNVIYFEGGTGTIAAQCREVTARASASSITIDTAIAASTGMTMNIGGAAGTPGWIGGKLVAGNRVYQKAGTYTLTNGTANTSAGPVSLGVSTIIWEGYNAARGDLGTKPVIAVPGDGSVTAITVFALGAGSTYVQIVRNIAVDGAAQANISGFVDSYTLGSSFELLKVSNTTVEGIKAAGNDVVWRNEVTGFSGTSGITATGAGSIVGNYVHDGSTIGIYTNLGSGGPNVVGNIVDTVAGATSDCFYNSTGPVYFDGNVAYGCGRDGFRSNGAANYPARFRNNISESAVGVGFNMSAGVAAGAQMWNNATFANGSVSNNIAAGNIYNSVAGSASFFTNAPAGNFSLNTVAGAGAAARAAGLMGVFPSGLTIGYRDIGAAQHADPAGFQTSNASVK